MITVRGLSKRYGTKLAVDDLSFTVQPGRVTGFLGPNGAGKSTTMRMIVGLDRPTSGDVTVQGQRYVDAPVPLRLVGSLLDAGSVHPGRSAYAHLLALAASSGIPKGRVQEVIDLVGLAEVARHRAGTYSLGMRQRLGIAAALLGDPAVIMLDEPVNGLDPNGIHWIRLLLRHLASEGRTVFISSHLMSEMALTADQLVILGRGRLLADVSMADMISTGTDSVRIRSRQVQALQSALGDRGIAAESIEPQVLVVRGRSTDEIAELAFAHRIVLTELTPLHASLEDAYLALTHDSLEYSTETENGRRVA